MRGRAKKALSKLRGKLKDRFIHASQIHTQAFY